MTSPGCRPHRSRRRGIARTFQNIRLFGDPLGPGQPPDRPAPPHAGRDLERRPRPPRGPGRGAGDPPARVGAPRARRAGGPSSRSVRSACRTATSAGSRSRERLRLGPSHAPDGRAGGRDEPGREARAERIHSRDAGPVRPDRVADRAPRAARHGALRPRRGARTSASSSRSAIRARSSTTRRSSRPTSGTERAMTARPLLELRGLDVRYGGIRALRGNRPDGPRGRGRHPARRQRRREEHDAPLRVSADRRARRPDRVRRPRRHSDCAPTRSCGSAWRTCPKAGGC